MKINDEYIKQIFFSKTGKFRKTWQELLKTEGVKEYLDNRFSDSESYKESIYRIQYSIETRPVCKICGAKLPFLPDICINGKYETCYKGKYFPNTCSTECGNKLRDQNKRISQLLMFGVDNVFKSPEIIKKIDETHLKHFGVKRILCKGPLRDAIEENNLKTKGVKNLGGTPESIEKNKLTNYLHRGVTNCMFDPEIVDKIHDIHLANGSYGKSQEEDDVYEMLKQKYPITLRQYRDDRYLTVKGNRAKCDFYIPELDMFIEYQGYFTHGKHPFDINNPDDLKKANELYEEYGDEMDLTWILSDVYKRQQAKDNNLNYVELFDMKEAKEFINNLK